MTLSHATWRFLRPLQRTCRCVFAGPHFQAGVQYIREVAESSGRSSDFIEIIHAKTRDELMNAAPSADVALPFMQRFDASFVESAENLRLIIQFGVGLEGVDVDAATRRGVAVSNVPASHSRNAEATAEHALLLSLSLLRHAPADLRRRFEGGELGGLPIPRTLFGKRVAVVGYGAVGSTLCSYLAALGARVTAVRRREWCDVRDGGVHERVVKGKSLEGVLPFTDLLVLACTTTPDTLNMMNDRTISMLPPGALIVNVGRGPLVDYSAVLRGLESGSLGGFASDVGIGGHPNNKPSEPWDPKDKLSLHPNTLFTPHVGGYCDVSYQKMAAEIFNSIERVVRGEPPIVWVNQPAEHSLRQDLGFS